MEDNYCKCGAGGWGLAGEFRRIFLVKGIKEKERNLLNHVFYEVHDLFMSSLDRAIEIHTKKEITC